MESTNKIAEYKFLRRPIFGGIFFICMLALSPVLVYAQSDDGNDAWYAPEDPQIQDVAWYAPDTSGGSGQWYAPDTSGGGSGQWNSPDTGADTSGRWYAPDSSAGDGTWAAPDTTDGSGRWYAPDSSGGNGQWNAPDTGGSTPWYAPDSSGGSGQWYAPDAGGDTSGRWYAPGGSGSSPWYAPDGSGSGRWYAPDGSGSSRWYAPDEPSATKWYAPENPTSRWYAPDVATPQNPTYVSSPSYCGGCSQPIYTYSQPCCTSYGYQYSYSAPVYTASCGCYSYAPSYPHTITGGIFTGSVVIPPDGPGNPQPPDSPVYPSHPYSYVNAPTYGQNYGANTYPLQNAPGYNMYQPQQYQNTVYGGNSQIIQVTQNPVQTSATYLPYITEPARVGAVVTPSTGPMVALSQVPYTGIDFDILFTGLIVLVILAVLGGIAYFFGFFKKGMFGRILFGIY